MKPEPAPNVPGKTPWERMNNALRTVLTVPLKSVQKEETKLRRQRQKKRDKKKKTS